MIRTVRASQITSILSGRRSRSRNIEAAVRRIVDEVRRSGDEALFRFRRLYDRIDSDKLMVGRHAMDHALRIVDGGTKKAIEVAIERVTRFHEYEKRHRSSWRVTESRGVSYGEFFTPVESVGLYVPGGSASYPSSVVMNAVPAIVAGVPDIVMATPSPSIPVLAAARMLGIRTVYSMGGAHAIAALAYGTRHVRRVDKIAGPGNRYVTLAKKLVFGDVGIDTIAGPSEVVVVTDGSMDPSFAAADLMAQAEHDELAMSVLIAPNQTFIGTVDREIQKLVRTMGRKTTICKSLRKNGFAVVAATRNKAMKIANSIAPEHLELAVKNPQSYLGQVRHAGAVFLGAYTPEVIGDYVAGPDHVLPTAGAARFSSGLGVDDFRKKTTLLRVTRSGFSRLAPYAEQLGTTEGLGAHALAVRIRTKK